MDLKNIKKISIFKKLIFFSFCGLLGFSSILNIFLKKDQIKDKLILATGYTNPNSLGGGKPSDKEWAKKIMYGGYILHFRHAERDKWIDVQMYDSLESDVHKNGLNESRYAEKDYFKNAVCLNKRGLIQARAMGEHLKNINFPIGYVVSSPSCRSRQTADIAFGGYSKMERLLVHTGPYLENMKVRNKNLSDFYLSLPIEKGKNTIVSSHNGVLRHGILHNVKKGKLTLEEGGFYVLSKKNGKLYLKHEFHNFNTFISMFYERN